MAVCGTAWPFIADAQGRPQPSEVIRWQTCSVRYCRNVNAMIESLVCLPKMVIESEIRSAIRSRAEVFPINRVKVLPLLRGNRCQSSLEVLSHRIHVHVSLCLDQFLNIKARMRGRTRPRSACLVLEKGFFSNPSGMSVKTAVAKSSSAVALSTVAKCARIDAST
jgi:hypothetical protein